MEMLAVAGMTENMNIALIIYLVFLIAIALRSAWRVKDIPDFFVARKAASAKAVAGSLVATILGGSAVIGAVDSGAKLGGAASWFMLVGALGLLALIPFAGRAYSHGKYALPDLVENLYGKGPRLVASFVIPVAWTGIVAAQIIAAAKLLMTFTSMGNHFLLDWHDCQMVEMSRSATDNQMQERLQLALAAAYNGAVTYTAAISKGERLIARTLREQGYPLVVLLNDGFPEEGSPHERFYKPGGVYFEACCRGQLLLLEPVEQSFLDAGIQAAVEETLRRKAAARHFCYTRIPVTSQRYRFVALNEMAKRLVKGDDKN